MIGIDESGKFYVVSGPPSARHCHAGPFDREADCRSKARAMGLDGALVRLAGRTVVGGADALQAMGDQIEEVLAEALAELLAPLALGGRAAAKRIKAATYTDDERRALVAAEREGKARVTVLRALGVEV